MPSFQTPVFLIDGATGIACNATLVHAITESHLHNIEFAWRPWLENALANRTDLPRPESLDWDWRNKLAEFRSLPYFFSSFAIECREEVQGLMIVSTDEVARIPNQRGLPLVYVEYLETAPWNRPTLETRPRFKGVGSVLLGTAIKLSEDIGFAGRIGLHSLAQAEAWYTSKCGMTDLGVDDVEGLRYFEMVADQAAAFISKGK